MRMRKEERWALVFSLLAAAVLLLFFSRSSPLYPINPWGESNAFFTVGRGMLAGKVPYRDLAYDAGPVVYALHALAACISPADFLGVWLLEIASMAALLFIAWKTALHVCDMPVLSAGVVALLGLILTSAAAFACGDTAEEFALPLQMWALYDLIRYMGDPERRMSSWRMVVHGFLAGCLLWMKYSLVGIYAAFIAVIAIDAMVREWELRGAAWLCLEFAAGGFFATAPWVAYLGANGALKEFYRLYLARDWVYFAETITPLRSTFMGLAGGVRNNPVMALVILCGAGFLLRRLVQRRWNAVYTAVVVSFACEAVLAYIEDVRVRYTHLAAGPFLMLCAVPLVLLARYAWRQRRICAAGLACCAILCAGYSCYENNNLPLIGYPEEELPQVKVAKYIEENGGGSLLTYRMCDEGFYLAAKQEPQWNAFVNLDESGCRGYSRDKQYKLVDWGEADWIVSASKYDPSGLYIRVKTFESEYNDMRENGNGRIYYLYSRIAK